MEREWNLKNMWVHPKSKEKSNQGVRRSRLLSVICLVNSVGLNTNFTTFFQHLGSDFSEHLSVRYRMGERKCDVRWQGGRKEKQKDQEKA